MTCRWLAGGIVACALAGRAAADPEHDAELALRDAEQRAAAGDATALDALENLGASQPITRWTDDAWRAAARLAERAHDLARARRDLEQAIATTDDAIAQRRAQADIARLAAIAGESGQWSTVATEHDRLARELGAAGDPRPALRELETLIRDHPGYPRAAMALVGVAQGWEREGEAGRAFAIVRDAEGMATASADRMRVTAELTRMLIRHGELAAARDEMSSLTDPALVRELAGRLRAAEVRGWLRHGALAIIILIAAAAVLALRRAAGSWSRAARRVVRPPAEVIFFAPIAAVLAAIAHTGNPLAARAVVGIAVGGTLVAWVSGTLLDARLRPLTRAGLSVHVLLAVTVVAATIFIAVDHDRMLDVLVETWRGGPAPR